jgi:hypothetical protein
VRDLLLLVQRKVVTPNDFYDLADAENPLMAFQDLYTAATRPFNWRYTTTDLNALLARMPLTNATRP